MRDAYRRFMVSAFPDYYPGGGLFDCIGSFDDLEEARAYARDSDFPFSAQILDRVEGMEVDL